MAVPAVPVMRAANAEADLELQHAEALASMMQQLAGGKESYGEVKSSVRLEWIYTILLAATYG